MALVANMSTLRPIVGSAHPFASPMRLLLIDFFLNGTVFSSLNMKVKEVEHSYVSRFKNSRFS